MHLPIAHLSGFEEDPSEELQAQLQANSGSHSHEDEEGSHSQSQGSKDGTSGGSAPDAGKPPKDLPCPRCQSMNTKFCYYNNYSVNQPRHFCRNCQRYWTVGGTLRNVPVGGGSRKKTRTRSRSDPYYRPGAASSAPSAGSEEFDSDGRHGQHPAGGPAMAGMAPSHPDGAFGDGVYPDFPFHPSQISSFLQFALQPSHGLGFPPFLDTPGFPVSADEEAELQAFYEATSQSGFLGNAAAMLGSGLFLPELEPAHLALMHKAALWAEAQRLQSLARRAQCAQAAAWADQERECKPVVSAPVLQQRSPALEELGHRQPAASLHRRPGFWETALMHSRPSPLSKRPAASSQPPWEDTKPAALPHDDNAQLDVEEGATRAASAAYSQAAGYDESPSWGGALNSNPEMFY